MTANHPLATIHLDHIAANLALAKSLAPQSKQMAVIKANAYGHGFAEITQCLTQADAFAVARVEEGVQLRAVLPNKPIVVLEGYLDNQEVKDCELHRLSPVLHSDYQIELLPTTLPFWLKFNTGMFRLGFEPGQASELARRFAGYNLKGLMSHFANGDDPEHKLNQAQIDMFEKCRIAFPEADCCMGNSGALMGFQGGHGDWVRPGLMLYGGAPSGRPEARLKPGMTLSAPIISINHLDVGDAVGYGSSWVAEKPSRIAVVALGYADGYPREMPGGTPIIISGQRRPLVGRVSMDMCTVLLEDADQVQPGDHAIFWGGRLPIDEIAAAAGTISYTLMTGLGARVKRRYEAKTS